VVEAYETKRTEADEIVVWYDAYDKTMSRWLLNGVKRGGKSVPMVFATPERAFGQMAQFLSKRFDRHYDRKSIPLPFNSIQRLDATFDVPDRWRLARVRHAQALAQNDEPVGEKHEYPDDKCVIFSWRGYAWPTPTRLPYQLDVWGRNLRDLDLITQQVILLFDFGDETWLRVKHPEPFGWRICPVTLERVSNNSQLEVQDGEQRSLRRTIAFRIDGWIPKPATDVKSVRRVDVEFEEMD
jgi:hypothetical protein